MFIWRVSVCLNLWELWGSRVLPAPPSAWGRPPLPAPTGGAGPMGVGHCGLNAPISMQLAPGTGGIGWGWCRGRAQQHCPNGAWVGAIGHTKGFVSSHFVAGPGRADSRTAVLNVAAMYTALLVPSKPFYFLCTEIHLGPVLRLGTTSPLCRFLSAAPAMFAALWCCYVLREVECQNLQPVQFLWVLVSDGLLVEESFGERVFRGIAVLCEQPL